MDSHSWRWVILNKTTMHNGSGGGVFTPGGGGCATGDGAACCGSGFAGVVEKPPLVVQAKTLLQDTGTLPHEQLPMTKGLENMKLISLVECKRFKF